MQQWRLLGGYTLERSLNMLAFWQLAVLPSPTEFKNRNSETLARQVLDGFSESVLIKALWAVLVGRSSRGGLPRHPESHGDNALPKKPSQSLFEFVDQETLLSYVSLGLLKPFISLESNLAFCLGKILLFIQVFIHSANVYLARQFFKDTMASKTH